MKAEAELGEHYPYTERNFEFTELLPNFRVDLRNARNEQWERFIDDKVVKDWSQLRWQDVGRPYRVENMSETRTRWERENERVMPVKMSWELFNKSFHEWFEKDVPTEMSEARRSLLRHMLRFRAREVGIALHDLVQLGIWNFAHRISDGIWDPRGKRALFQGLDVVRPRILFLGAAEGYEAMQLHAMYPGGEVVLVDYDEFCKTQRFGDFPESYPFLGSNPATGAPRVWYKGQMNISYLVDDIRNLTFGREFDIVLSVGLLEHFPDELKPEVMEWHRKFLKPGGYVIMTTPRQHNKTKLFYRVMEDVMNHTYRELMTVRQMGLFVYENGFDIVRHGVIKVHNGIVAKERQNG